jgi:hypothetical protein
MHKTERDINIYAETGLRVDVERTVNKLISVRQRWIVIGIGFIFIIYVVLAVYIGIATRDVKKDSFEANNVKRELAYKTDSLQRIKIQEEREQIAYARTTDSLKRIELFKINSNYEKSIEEWKQRRKSP